MTSLWQQTIPEHPLPDVANGLSESSHFIQTRQPSLYEAESLAALAAFNKRNQAWSALGKISFNNYLQADSRPTFVVDWPAQERPKKLAPVYLNPAILREKTILDQIHGNFHKQDVGMSPWRAYSEFLKWVYDDVALASSASSFLFRGYLWAAVTVEERWRVVSGTSYNDMYNRDDDKSKLRRSSAASVSSRERMLARQIDRKSNSSTPDQLQRIVSNPVTEQHHPLPDAPQEGFDWISQDPDELSNHARLVRDVDWASTSLGATDTWSPQLRLASNLVMTDPSAAILFWGEDCSIIYNEHYAPIIEAYHPWCLGTSMFDSLKEYNEHIVPVINAVRRNGEAIYQKDLPLFLVRDGMLEEAWFSLTFHPVLGANGQVEGILEQVRETTRLKITERRLGTFIELGAHTAVARHLGDLWDLAFEALAKNEKDVPFALLYSIMEGDSATDRATVCSRSKTYGKRAVLRGSLGVPNAPVCICLEKGDAGFMPWFRESLKTREMIVLSLDDGSLDPSLIEGVESRAFGEPCRAVAISPVMPTSGDHVLGFFVVGINPRRPFDEGYQKFVKACAMLLATSMASVVFLEGEVGRRKTIVEESALAQAELAQQIELKQKRIESQERKFQRMTEKAEIGIFAVTPAGQYLYRNQRWFDLLRVAKDVDTIESTWQAIAVSDTQMEMCRKNWDKLTSDKKPITFELKLNQKWSSKSKREASAIAEEDRKMWVVVACYPEFNEDGSLKEFVGMVVDISQQKWAECLQKMRTRDALESKRALENFIDTTSHEMRNPLSAITQTADWLLNSALRIVGTYAEASQIPQERKELLQIVIESAQTIIECSSHQKRIVDDVLTMSKIDLLPVSPVDSQPEYELRYALRVFEIEAREAKITVEFLVDKSYKDLGVNWVKIDPTRMNQIFVNMITNAIKYTRLEKSRCITITLGAVEEAPEQINGVRIIEASLNVTDPTLQTAWGSGSPIYLTVMVQDTGRGLTMEEQEEIFMRFSQAMPKTSTHYGGGGLGLYIGRRLTELHGGGIGFASTFGEGSTFSFFVKGKRSANQNQKPRFQAVGEFNLSHSETWAKIPDLLRRSSSSQSVLEQTAHGDEEKEKNKPASPVESPPGAIHVLVVEDNLVNQKVLAKQLRSLGCIVEVANHGVEALSHLEKTTFWPTPTELSSRRHLSIVLMDWEMPVMDGLTCVRKIRQLQNHGTIIGHVPVIAVTANARHEQVEQAMEAGMDDVVSKPFRVPELMVRMNSLLEKLEEATSPGATNGTPE